VSAVLFFLAGAPALEYRRSPWLARHALQVYVTGALISLGLALSQASPLVAALTFAPLTLLCITVGIVSWGAARSLVGELCVALALSSWALPVAACSSLSFAECCWVWLPFASYFTVSTVVVRHLMPGARRRDGLSRGRVLGLCSIVLGASMGGASSGLLPFACALALIPAGLLPALLVWLQPPPTHIRAVGWALLSGSLLTLALTGIAFTG
jgi:hypothetical protein